MGQPVGSQYDHAAEETGGRAADDAAGDHRDRIGDTIMRRGDAGGIGAGAKEGGMAERGHAAIAGDEIKRQDEKRHREDAGQERQIVGEREIPDPGKDENCKDPAKSRASERRCLEVVTRVSGVAVSAMITLPLQRARAETRR